MSTDLRVIARDRLFLILSACFSPVFVVIGVWILFDDILAGIVIGLPAIGFFGFIFYRALRSLFDTRPGLIIDSDGVVYNLTGASTVRVPWSEVTGVSTLSVVGQTFIVVDVKDPENFPGNMKPMRRLSALLFPGLSASPLQISANTLKISSDELLATLRRYFEKYAVTG